MTDRMDNVISTLQGTIGSMWEACESNGFNEDELTIEETEQLDEAITQCEGCGWWVETSDCNNENENGDYVCHNCV